MSNHFDIENGVLQYYAGKEDRTVVVPEGVTAIDEYAFVSNESVTEVVLPKGLTEIGKSAFGTCENLQKVTLPDTLEFIAEQAFYGCTNLREIVFPASLTKIDEEAFAHCKSLRTLTIPGSIKEVSAHAFECCDELSELTLCEGVEKIECDAFSDCPKLSEIKLPATLTWIGKGAFCACAIKELTLHDSITHIGADAFHNCEKLEGVYIGKGVKEIGNAAFGYCENLKRIDVTKGNECFAVVGNCLIDVQNKTLLQATPDFEIPADGSVTAFADGAFGGLKSIRSFEVPAFIETIEDYAFCDCKSLRKLTVHRDNKHYVAKNDCIIEIATGKLIAGCSPSDIPSDGSVKIIASGAFTASDELTSLSIPEGVLELNNFAFASFSALRSVRLPDSLVTVGVNAFMDCEKLQSVSFGSHLEKIDHWAFAGCKSLEEIEFPESLTFIGEHAFYEVPLKSAKFRAPKFWFGHDWHCTPKPVKLKNPKKAAALLAEKDAMRSFERKPK